MREALRLQAPGTQLRREQGLAELALQCLHLDPPKRPSAVEVAESLSKVAMDA